LSLESVLRVTLNRVQMPNAPRQMIPTTLRDSPGGNTIQAIAKPTRVKASPAHASRCFQMNDKTFLTLLSLWMLIVVLQLQHQVLPAGLALALQV